MDSSINPSIILSSSTSTDAAMVPINRDTFMATYIPHQQWSFPDSIIYYISKNPSSAKVYGKLIQSCKYFMIRNPPPIVVKDLKLKQRNNHLKVAFDKKSVDFNNVPSKIWLTNKLNVSSSWLFRNGQNLLSILIPKICQSSIKTLNLGNQICSLNDLKFLGSKCERIFFGESIVINESGAIVPLEDVFQLFPNARNFKFHFGNQGSVIVTPKTFLNLVKTPHFLNLQSFSLYQLPESFDLIAFYDYMKKNKKTDIYLSFCNEISDEYRTHLQAIFDEIVADESRDFKIPYFNFFGFDVTDFGNLKDLFYR